jgi:hypothetical protein
MTNKGSDLFGSLGAVDEDYSWLKGRRPNGGKRSGSIQSRWNNWLFLPPLAQKGIKLVRSRGSGTCGYRRHSTDLVSVFALARSRLFCSSSGLQPPLPSMYKSTASTTSTTTTTNSTHRLFGHRAAQTICLRFTSLPTVPCFAPSVGFCNTPPRFMRMTILVVCMSRFRP